LCICYSWGTDSARSAATFRRKRWKALAFASQPRVRAQSSSVTIDFAFPRDFRDRCGLRSSCKVKRETFTTCLSDPRSSGTVSSRFDRNHMADNFPKMIHYCFSPLLSWDAPRFYRFSTVNCARGGRRDTIMNICLFAMLSYVSCE